jgi:hypothetical protein
MQEIDKLPEFNVQKLLEGALRKLESANLGGMHYQIIEAARNEVAAVLAAQAKGGEELQDDVERTLRQTAKCLMSVSDLNVESARLAIMSAADMLRVA